MSTEKSMSQREKKTVRDPEGLERHSREGSSPARTLSDRKTHLMGRLAKKVDSSVYLDLGDELVPRKVFEAFRNAMFDTAPLRGAPRLYFGLSIIRACATKV